MDNLEDWGIDRLIKNGGVMTFKGGETMKVIKSRDKNFEEEKAKMFEPKVLNKEEQLRLIFSHLLTAFIADFWMAPAGTDDKIIKKYTNIFMKEIKIRIKL